jgi:hypothetical protein
MRIEIVSDGDTSLTISSRGEACLAPISKRREISRNNGSPFAISSGAQRTMP